MPVTRAGSPAPPERLRLHRGVPLWHWLVRVHGWLVLVMIGLFSLINPLGPTAGVRAFPLFLLAELILVVLGVAIALVRFRRPSAILRAARPAAWVCLAAATVLFGFAMVSAAWRQSVVFIGQQPPWTRVIIPTVYTLMPAACALVTVWAAFLVILITPTPDRFALLWRISAVMVPLSLIGWARVWRDDHSSRLWTQFGGAAVYPMLLLLCLGIAVAGVMRPYRPRWSAWLVVCHMVLMVLTGSRGSLLVVVAFLGLSLLRLGRTHTGIGARLAKLPKVIWVIGGLAIIGAALMSPLFDRLTHTGEGRLMTWKAGWRAMENSWDSILFGAGLGTVWPWFAYESGWLALPWRGRIRGPDGATLYHAHSVYVTVLVELGVVGVALLAIVIYTLVAQWFRGGTAASVVLSSATLACLVGFALDTMLVKNFPISFVWWLVAFTVLTTYTQGYPKIPAMVAQLGLSGDPDSGGPPAVEVEDGAVDGAVPGRHRGAGIVSDAAKR